MSSLLHCRPQATCIRQPLHRLWTVTGYALTALCLTACVSGVRVAAPSAATTPGPSGSSASAARSQPAPSPGSAAAVLAGLAVKGRAPKTGYDRARFGAAWTDDNTTSLGHNGCDTRNDILKRDLTAVLYKPGSRDCAVRSGLLLDPYTGRPIPFRRGVTSSREIQIDHVVALSDAWQKGAQRLSAGRRTDFANDPLNLLAVDGPTNESKGDGDAATWLPPNKAYRCAYVARQLAVKQRYGLWLTPAEHDAIARVLSTCPDQLVPV